jgi:hypothetical protein
MPWLAAGRCFLLQTKTALVQDKMLADVRCGSEADMAGTNTNVRYSPAGSTGRRNTRVMLSKRSPNRLHDFRLPAMPKLQFLGRS